MRKIAMSPFMRLWAPVSLLPVISAAALLQAACALLSGCYTLNQGTTMLGYLNRAVPLEKSGDEEFAVRVHDIRLFAMEELGLSAGKNYTRYVQIDRDYLAAVVSASSDDSFHAHEWRYPVVGSLPYKGFFNVKDAQKEKAKLEKKGLDVWVRGVDAFSTLGWFKDPLYSFMRAYTPYRFADLIIHELLHATVFVKGQAGFNEELAEFIGSEGARLYVVSRFGADSEEYRSMLISEVENKKYVDFIRQLIAELDALYSSGLGREEKLKEKERLIAGSKEHFTVEYDNLFSSDNYKGYADLPINNAYLELYRLYYAEDSFFADLYERSGRNLPAFIAAAKTITSKDGDPRVQLESRLLRE